MAIDKNFVIKNGLEVNEDLLYADDDTGRVGVGITTPGSKLDVIGDISATGIASAGLAVTSHDAYFTGFCTAIEGFNIGIGGTVFNVDSDSKKVGINSVNPTYTTDIRGPVSTGTTALYVFGDLEVTGDIRADELFGQISDGGTVGFATVSVSQRLTAPDSEVYTLFNVEQDSGTDWEFISGGGDPAGIGFTENTLNPTLYLLRGKKYHFDVNTPGFPFYLKRDEVADTNNQYLDGVEGNGAQVGIVTFKVPYSAPAQLFYQASNTANMGGLINVVGVDTGYNDNLLVPGIATITRANVEWLNVTGFSTLGGNGASATMFEVTGFSTLGNVSASGVNATGVITASQFIGVGRSSETVEIGSRNDSNVYQIGFATAGTGYKHVFVDSNSAQLTYKPDTSALTASLFVGDLGGVASNSDSIQVDERNDNTNYQVGFVTANGTSYQTVYIDTDDTQFLYNPSTHTLISGTFEGNLTGTATTATQVTVSESDANTNFTPVFVSATGDVSLSRDNQFTYNASTNRVTAGSFAGNGANLTALNATQLTTGTVPGNRGVTAGSADSSFVEYNGTTRTAGQFYGGTTNPNGTTRLNYSGQLHATGFTGPLTGNADTASQVFVTENDTNTDSGVLFADGTGNVSVLRDNQFTYNASTNRITVNRITCTQDTSNFQNINATDVEVDSLNVTNNTASTSRTTGAIRCSGGVGIVGALNVGGDITAFATSDERLKDNIEPIPNALLKIKKISGNTFDWKEESSRSGSECGVIAQEIESLGLPGLVTTRDDGHKAVRYEKLVPLLIEAIKELTERVQELEK